MSSRPIHVRILDRDYRIASDGEGASRERILAAASLVDETMRRIRERTGTVDTVSVAVLAALNVARRYVALRDEGAREARVAQSAAADAERIRTLADRVEAVVTGTGSA